MNRDLARLDRESFDVIVVGGGIFGLCVAWEAITRGLSVALVEAKDYAHATSANCFKVAHGGVRYMQHGDVPRVRASARERSILLQIAPHLTQPLPIVIPTFGQGKQGKAFLKAGMTAYDFLTIDRNRHIADPARKIPGHQTLDRGEVLCDFPWLSGDEGANNKLTGGVLFYDGQLLSPERLALAIAKSASIAGACVANYVEVLGFIRSGNSVCGVKARDSLTDDRFEIRGRIVVNAAGPWAERLLKDDDTALSVTRPSTFSRDAWFLLQRPWVSENALAIQAQNKDPDAILSRNARHLFIVPWRGHTIVGVWHQVSNASPDDVNVQEEDIQSFIDEINWACPELAVSMGDVGYWNAGLVLFGDNQTPGRNLSFGKRSRLIDHTLEHGVDGLVTSIGVRYTTARGEAVHTIDLVQRKMKSLPTRSETHRRQLFGGDIDDTVSLRTDVMECLGATADPRTVRAIASFHGSNFRAMLAPFASHSVGETDREQFPRVGNTHVLRQEVIHACHNEQAIRLEDVVLRRTELASGGHPGAAALNEVAGIMAKAHGWKEARRVDEIRQTESMLTHRRYRETVT